MLLKQLGDDFVLGLDLGLQFFDPALLGILLPSLVGVVGLAEERDAPAFEELLLPSVVLGGVDLMLVAQIGDRDVVASNTVFSTSVRSPC